MKKNLKYFENELNRINKEFAEINYCPICGRRLKSR